MFPCYRGDCDHWVRLSRAKASGARGRPIGGFGLIDIFSLSVENPVETAPTLVLVTNYLEIDWKTFHTSDI